jgi:molybdenum cofactor biosynthesis protein B
MTEASKGTRVATVTVSDTKTVATDDAGKLCRQLFTDAGYVLARQVVIKDERSFVSEIVRDLVDGNVCDAIVLLSGGSAVTRPDHVQAALDPMFESRIDGFGEAFRRLAWEELGVAAFLARAIAGVVNGCILFVLPESEDAVRLGMTKLILPALPLALRR